MSVETARASSRVETEERELKKKRSENLKAPQLEAHNLIML